MEKFYLPAVIFDGDAFQDCVKAGIPNPFRAGGRRHHVLPLCPCARSIRPRRLMGLGGYRRDPPTAECV